MDLHDGNGIMPVYNLDGNGGMFGNGGGSWIFFLFFLLAWGNNGLGGFGNNKGVATEIGNDFMYSNLNNTLQRGFDELGRQHSDIMGGVQGINKGICDSTYALKSTMDAGLNSLQGTITESAYHTQRALDGVSREIADCCCNTNRNIDSVKYEMSKGFCDVITSGNINTRDIIEAGNNNTQRIIDKLTQSEIDGLRTQLQSANLALSNNSQTMTLIEQLKPCPRPAYVVPNPCCPCPIPQ